MTAALETYAAIRREGRLADRALAFALRRRPGLSADERPGVVRDVYALLRRERLADFLLDRARTRARTRDGRPDRSPSPARADRLRLAAVRVLEGGPPADVARALRLGARESALLAALQRGREALARRPALERMAIEEGLPDFVAERFRDAFGAEAPAAAAALNATPPLTVRVNTLRTDRDALARRLRDEGVAARATPLSPLGLVLETRSSVYELASFREGLFEVQDEGSQLLGMLVDAPPRTVVDACAGAGGKTLQLAAQMRNRGELVALDVAARPLEQLRRRARRAGVHNVRVQRLPAAGPRLEAALAPWHGRAWRVLVDAPCSGSGALRRNPDARYRLDAARLAEHVARQRALLATFAPLVRRGGRLVYGTCSVLPEEGEEVVADFLAREPAFALRPAADVLGAALAPLARRVAPEGVLRVSPHVHGTDGFFGAVLERERA